MIRAKFGANRTNGLGRFRKKYVFQKMLNGKNVPGINNIGYI